MGRQRLLFATTLLTILCGLLFLATPSCREPVPSDPGRLHANTYPETRVANIPVNDDSAKYLEQGVIPQQSFYWVGDDPDGFVIAYRFRWTDSSSVGVSTTPWSTILNVTNLAGNSLDTLMLVPGNAASLFRIYNFLVTLQDTGTDAEIGRRIVDSLKTGRAFAVPYRTGLVAGDSLLGADPVNIEAPTKATFIFSSPSDSNMHRFEVASVDNNDAQDPTPAFVHFWTKKSPIPIAFIVTLPSGQWVLRYPTETNPGITFSFGAFDPSTSERDFSWSVDDTLHWSPWSPQPIAVVTAANFQRANTDTHKLYVRVKNKWGVVSPPSDSLLVAYQPDPNTTIYVLRDTFFIAYVPPIDDPLYPKKTLIINNSRVIPPGNVDTNAVKAFYSEIMDSLGIPPTSFYIWTTSSNSYRFPPLTELVKHTSVLFLFEQQRTPPPPFGDNRLFTGVDQNTFKQYLRLGGKLVYSGTPNLVLAIESYDKWADSVFHAIPIILQNNPLTIKQNSQKDFVAAKGFLGYPNVRLDSTKFPPYPDSVGIRNVGLNYPRGFGQGIFAFDSARDSVGFENQPIGVRYLAPPAVPPARQTYSVVFLGFPLYYAVKSDAIQVLRKAFQDINE